MAEITTAAYQEIRDFIQANWTHIGLYDNAGTPVQIVRYQIGGVDDHADWTHAGGAAVLEVTVTVKGTDFALPKTIAGSRIFTSSASSTSLSTETFTPFTLQTAEDELTIKHRIEVPDQP